MRIVLGCGLGALLLGCAGREPATAPTPSPASPARVAVATETPRKPILSIPDGSKAKPIQLRKVIAKLDRGEVVGEQKAGLLCIPHGHLTWQGGHVLASTEELTTAFHDALQHANYPVVGNPDALFPDSSESRAELMVGGLIDKINVNACFPKSGFGNLREVKGSSYLHVKWQIYDVMARKVVYETATDGSYRTGGTVDGGTSLLLTNAFDDAVENLLADQGFHDLVMRDAMPTNGPAPTTFEVIQMRAAPARAISIRDARAASVTVLTSTGHGSGFIVSPEGYVITNQHVVEEAQKVKVKLATEREIVGDVLRTDPVRDVALIKLEASDLPAVDLRVSSLEVGEEVFAIGAPLTEQLDITVTRGIVSAYRTDRGLSYIQSDVAVHPGNSGGPLTDKAGAVIGICDWGIQPQGIDENLNFFIPIGEALRRLNIELKPAGDSGRMQ